MKLELVAFLMSNVMFVAHLERHQNKADARMRTSYGVCLLRVYKYVGVNLAVRYNFSMYPFNQMQDELLQATKQLSIPLIHDSIVLYCL